MRACLNQLDFESTSSKDLSHFCQIFSLKISLEPKSKDFLALSRALRAISRWHESHTETVGRIICLLQYEKQPEGAINFINETCFRC